MGENRECLPPKKCVSVFSNRVDGNARIVIEGLLCVQCKINEHDTLHFNSIIPCSLWKSIFLMCKKEDQIGQGKLNKSPEILDVNWESQYELMRLFYVWVHLSIYIRVFPYSVASPITVSERPLIIFRNQGKKYLISRSGQEIWKMNLGSLVIPDSEKAIRNRKVHAGAPEANRRRTNLMFDILLVPPNLAIIIRILKIRLLSDFRTLILTSTTFIWMHLLIGDVP